MSPARLEHFIFGIVLWVAYLWLEQRGNHWLHPVSWWQQCPPLSRHSAVGLGHHGIRHRVASQSTLIVLSHISVWPGMAEVGPCRCG